MILSVKAPEQRICEHCTRTTPSHEAYSFVLCTRRLDKKNGYAFFQCRGVEQHWACSFAAARDLAIKCLQEHHNESQMQLPLGVVIPEKVWEQLQACEHCQTPIDVRAYHISVDYATPYPTTTCEHIACSLDHAIELGVSCLKNHFKETGKIVKE